MEFDWTKVIMYVAYLVLIVFIPWLISIIRGKTENEKARNLLRVAEEFAHYCVETIEQTYVIPSKDAGTWDEEAAKEAFEQCKDLILAGLGENVKKAIDVLFGNFDVWVKAVIESEVLTLHQWND